ncbi:unnamed protein product [Schistosoma intercalatum]|nr:unnamed protein product [Schistosoma intercalatum]
MGNSGTCLTDYLSVCAPEKVLLVISFCTVLLGFVLIVSGVCITQLSDGRHAHLSISYSAVPIVFAGCVTLLIAIVRIVSTSQSLREMNLTPCEFGKQWNKKESVSEPISYNLQENAYNVFSFANKSSGNFSSNSFSDKKVDHIPMPVTNYHQRLPMPPRRAVLY